MDALLLDYNGVIVNDEPLHQIAFREILGEEGITFTADEYRAHYLGRDERASFREAYRRAGRPADPAGVERQVQRKSRLYQSLAERELQLVPGAGDFVREAAGRARIAVVSGALGAEIPAGLARAGIADLVEVLVSSDDVTTTKPDPAGFRLALQRLAAKHSTDTWRALVVEDSVPGVAAARALGGGCLALTTSHSADELAGADLVWDAFAGHRPAELDGLWRRVEVG